MPKLIQRLPSLLLGPRPTGSSTLYGLVTASTASKAMEPTMSVMMQAASDIPNFEAKVSPKIDAPSAGVASRAWIETGDGVAVNPVAVAGCIGLSCQGKASWDAAWLPFDVCATSPSTGTASTPAP